MNVLSLFDGLSAGQVALERAGIKVDKYFASEIDKHAIKVTMANYPNTIQLGDVCNIRASDLPKIDLLIAGTPCQGFSFAGKQLAFNDPRSALFFEYVRLLRECRPKYFLLENVRMKKEHLDVISEQLGVEPVVINSSLVSAQNRVRYYWANFPITQPQDKGIMLKDIIEQGEVDRDKSHCLDASYFKGGNLKSYFEKHRRQLVFNYSSSGRGNGIIEGRFTDAEKALTLTAAGYSNRSISAVMEDVENFTWRKLTPLECERLQTFEDNYTAHISNTQRYKALGNSWTVDVIAHIFGGLI
jgi:DNA-cytosine methyltransferase